MDGGRQQQPRPSEGLCLEVVWFRTFLLYLVESWATLRSLTFGDQQEAGRLGGQHQDASARGSMHPRGPTPAPQNRTLWGRSPGICFNKPVGRFWRSPECESHCYRGSCFAEESLCKSLTETPLKLVTRGSRQLCSKARPLCDGKMVPRLYLDADTCVCLHALAVYIYVCFLSFW